MADYCTRDQVKEHVQISDSDRDNLIDQNLTLVSRSIDGWTRVPKNGWDNLTAKKITLAAKQEGDTYLFLPVKVQNITKVTHDGIVLVEGKDDDFLAREWYLERVTGGKFGKTFLSHSGWTSRPDQIEVEGDFGAATVPEDLVLACIEAVAIISGLKRNVFETNEGTSGSVLLTTLPTWVQRNINGLKRRHPMQAYTIT